MSHGSPKTLSLLDAACLQAETVLPPRLRGLRKITLSEAEETALDRLPAAARLSLILPAERALMRRLSLPAGTDAAKALSIWLEDAAPWASGSYLWDAAAAGDGTEWQVALVPLTLIQPVETRLERRGSEIAEILLTAADGQRFCLRPDRTGRTRLRAGLRALAVGLTVIGLGLTLWQGDRAVQARDRLAKAEAEVAALTASAASGSAGETARALAQAKAGILPIATRLALVAERLPRDAWLVQLALDGAHLTLAGRSATPEAIIPALSAGAGGPAIRNADFDGPIARDGQSGLFSFTIKGDIVEGGTP